MIICDLWQGLAEHCGDDEQLSSRTIKGCLEDDLWIKTAQLSTTYIPTWNI